MNQSFPPLSVVKELRRFTLKLEIADHPQLVVTETVRDTVYRTLKSAGFELLSDSENCDALLRLYVGTGAVLSIGDMPVMFSIVISLEALAAVRHHPSCDLFIIWRDMSYGTVDLTGLQRRVESSAANLAGNLIRRVKTA